MPVWNNQHPPTRIGFLRWAISVLHDTLSNLSIASSFEYAPLVTVQTEPLDILRRAGKAAALVRSLTERSVPKTDPSLSRTHTASHYSTRVFRALSHQSQRPLAAHWAIVRTVTAVATAGPGPRHRIRWLEIAHRARIVTLGRSTMVLP